MNKTLRNTVVPAVWGLALMAIALTTPSLGDGRVAAGPAFDHRTDAARHAGPGGRVAAITVHGRWTIDVLGRDGRLVRHRTFENSLEYLGQITLASLLGRTKSVGTWGIYVGSSTDGPCSNSGLHTPCIIIESTDAFSGADFFKNLTVDVTGPGNTAVLLQGRFTPERDTSIDSVNTAVRRCAPSATGCGNSVDGFYQFTDHTLASAIPVQQGQDVLVKVEISFS